VRLESTMRWAMIERMRVIGTSSPGMAAGTTGGAAGFAAAAAAAGAGVGVGAVTGGLGAGAAGAPPLAR
jgi:hypothetical protein